MTGIGRREANKREKLLRIRQAARTVFLSKGYEAATVREIAAAADVAFGTLFLYAKNKQDLLLLVFEDEFLPLAERAAASVSPDQPVVDQICSFFRGFYELFCATPELSRDMLREITFSTGGIVSERIRGGVQNIQQHLARILARAQAEGQVSSSVSPDLAAQVVFSLHRIELRFCLDFEELDIDSSLSRFRNQLQVIWMGLEAPTLRSSGLQKRRITRTEKLDAGVAR